MIAMRAVGVTQSVNMYLLLWSSCPLSLRLNKVFVSADTAETAWFSFCYFVLPIFLELLSMTQVVCVPLFKHLSLIHI